MSRLGDDPDAWTFGLPYRRGYAAAADRVDAETFRNTSHGRAHGKPTDAAASVDDLVRQLGRDAADPSVEAIRQGRASKMRWRAGGRGGEQEPGRFGMAPSSYEIITCVARCAEKSSVRWDLYWGV